MKNLFFSALAIATLFSCGSAMRKHFGATEADLIKTVSIEKGCPTDQIKVLDKVRGAMSATYSLEVCGTRMVYKQRPDMAGFEEVKN